MPENEPAKKKMKSEVYEDEPTDFFPLNNISIQMQLGMYEYLDGWSANELRKVDRLRRQIVDANPRIFEKKRLIPSVVVDGAIMDDVHKRANWGLHRLTYLDYCNFCQKRSNKITLHFGYHYTKNVKGTKYCNQCQRNLLCSVEHFMTNSFPVVGLTLEECCSFITKGSKIKKLRLNNFSQELKEGFSCLIDSSLNLELWNAKRGFVSTEWFMNLVQGPRGLMFHEDRNMELLDDEFYRTAGCGTFEVFYDFLPLTDKQLAILVGRNDLTDICLERATAITAEGVRRAVQIILHSSPKTVNTKFFMKIIGLESTLELDAESAKSILHEDGSIESRYMFGNGKVEVHVDIERSYQTLYIASHYA